MSNELAAVTFESMSGISVTLDKETVIRYCTRGNGDISEQEVAMFIRTCQAKKLDPLESGEVYLIKFGSEPAQIVVGKHAYVRRADRNPEYRGRKSGITVLRGNQVIQKEGCCLYKSLEEKLIGGWCRTYRQRLNASAVEETYREVEFDEYNKGQANWKTKPATMIEKVAVSQCLREAFPNEYEGLYSEDEMVASGVIPDQDYETVPDDGAPIMPDAEPVVINEPVTITDDQRKALFQIANEHFGKDSANTVLKNVLNEFSIENTKTMSLNEYNKVMARLIEYAEDLAKDGEESQDVS